MNENLDVITIKAAFIERHIKPKNIELTKNLNSLLEGVIEETIEQPCMIDDHPAQTIDDIMKCLTVRLSTGLQMIESITRAALQSDLHLDMISIQYRGRLIQFLRADLEKSDESLPLTHV